MSDLAKQLFDGLKAAGNAAVEVVPSLKNIVPDIKAETSRLGTQGAMELASMLFNGHGFVPYGPGQYTPTPEHSPDVNQNHQPERGIER